jgi:hypothetical protein
MNNEFFEVIYHENKLPLSFKEIYFGCNVKPLMEQVFREKSETDAVTARLQKMLQETHILL